MEWRNLRTRSIERAFGDAQFGAIRRTLELVGAESDLQVPIRTEDLRRTKLISMDDDPFSPSGAISYGGGRATGLDRAFYAIIVHERPARHDGGRKAGYLRDPFEAIAPKVYPLILRTLVATQFRIHGLRSVA